MKVLNIGYITRIFSNIWCAPEVSLTLTVRGTMKRKRRELPDRGD